MTVAKRHRVFTPKARKKVAPLSFDLYGETFECWPELQGSVILEFGAAMAGSSDEDGPDNSSAVINGFFDEALKPDSLKAFRAQTHSHDKITDPEELAEIVGWLLENYTSRDLGESSPEPENS